jgi:hypothetical protein
MSTNTSDYALDGEFRGFTPQFNLLTDKELDEAVKAFEIEILEERIAPYIVDMSKPLPEPRPLVSIDGCCVCSRGNISAICGEAKSKKTFLTSAIIASAMALPLRIVDNFKNVDNNSNLSVLCVDTEQGEQHVRKVIRRISYMTGALRGGAVSEPRLMTLTLRELSPAERKAVMLDTLVRYHFDIVVIDGIADLQRNTNDLEESDALITELMALSTKGDCHIVCVLHTNPGSDKARGHLGSSLQRKAESVLFVHRVGDTSVVEPQFCRNEPFERFAFTVNEEGIPTLCDIPSENPSTDPIITILKDFYGGSVERATLTHKVVEQLGINEGTAKMRIHRLISRGKLIALDREVKVVE